MKRLRALFKSDGVGMSGAFRETRAIHERHARFPLTAFPMDLIMWNVT